jgi:hypothetical protein
LAEPIEGCHLPTEQDLAVGIGLGGVSRAQASVVGDDGVFGLAGQRGAWVGDSELDEPLPQASRGELEGIADRGRGDRAG